MRPDRFLARFHRIAAAPDAIPRLRRFMLDLAVRGKLVAQDPREEPAANLLPARKDVDRSGSSASAELIGWERVTLKEMIRLAKGKKPKELNTAGRGLPYLDIAALERGEIRQFTEDERCPRATPNDLIIVCDGSRSGLVLNGANGVLGSTVASIEHSGFDRDYLKVFLTSLYEDLNGATKGAAIPHLNIPRLLQMETTIPPLAEQRRIVAKVHELMALCDRLEAAKTERETWRDRLVAASLHRLNNGAHADAFCEHVRFHLCHFPRLTTRPEHITGLRQTILNLAVQGCLTRQNPLEHVALTPHQTEHIVPNPKETATNGSRTSNWVWMKSKHVFSLKHGHQFRDYDFVRAGIPVIKIGQCKRDGTLDLAKCDYIADDRLKDFEHVRIYRGDILMALTGGTLGKVTVVNRDYGAVVQNYRVGKFIPHEQLYTKGFTVAILQSDLFQDLVSAAVNQNAQPNIGKDKIEQLVIPIPPLAEQHRIVAKVEELIALCDRLEAQLITSQTESRRLLEATLQDALAVTS